MFRAERPQKGRLRQFHQIGTEVIGTSSPFADAELIQQLSVMLGEFGLNGVTIKLNSLGCRADKERFAEETRKYLSGRKESLCEDCRAKLDKNVRDY
jgi:histidyl-tRNA synthetase